MDVEVCPMKSQPNAQRPAMQLFFEMFCDNDDDDRMTIKNIQC